MTRLDEYLTHLRSDELKRMARRWGPNPPTRSLECIEYISKALANPARVHAVIAALKPYEHAALALLKQAGGTLEYGALGVALRASGLPLPDVPGSDPGNANDELVRSLVQSGLIVPDQREYRYAVQWGHTSVYADERLLDQVAPFSYPILTLKPAEAPATRHVRRPAVVSLDVVGLLQAIENIGGLHLTRAGDVRSTDARKLGRTLGWQLDNLELDGLSFPDPTHGLASALFVAGLLTRSDDGLAVSDGARDLATLPYGVQARRILYGFVEASGWTEYRSTRWYVSAARSDWRGDGRARLALIVLLACLPPARDDWFAVDDLSSALFERVGHYFSIDGGLYRPYTYGMTPAEAQRVVNAWHKQLRTQWEAFERKWIAAALSSWLYYLGMVELGVDGSAPTSFRLTDLGRAALHSELEGSAPSHTTTGGPAWVVQPNLEVVVYLEHATAPQMAFLERHAERLNMQQHTAHYRLTRDSIYRGLESGTSLDSLLETLRAGSAHELPQNVRVELQGWAGLREQMTLRRRARLLEYGSAAERAAALKSGAPGTAIGERFILLPPGASPRRIHPRATIDYALPLAPCLEVDEDGSIRQVNAAQDLLLEGQLTQWAVRGEDGQWQFTPESVSAAIGRGTRRRQLFEWLAGRLYRALPPLMQVALGNWAGQRRAVDLADVTLLRCDAEAGAAIQGSRRLRRFVAGILAPDLILVKQGKLEAMRAELEWLGLQVGDDVTRGGSRDAGTDE